MQFTLLEFFDLIGTIAFATSGALVGVQKKMDIFGVNILALTTACGGGLMRDVIVGNIPPRMFIHPFFALIALAVANIVFLVMYGHRPMPQKLAPYYDTMQFLFDTFGLAAFTVDGVMIGVKAGYRDNLFLIVFLGFLTGVGGGALRDVLAAQMPYIFRKHVYAMASIVGGLMMAILLETTGNTNMSMVVAFLIVVGIRFMANWFKWNLPRIE